MSASHRSIPVPGLLAAVLALVVAVSIWQTVHFASANDHLRRELSERRTDAAAASVQSTTETSADLEAADVELEQARTRLRTVEAKADELAQGLGITPAEQLKSFGRVEELAVGGARFLKAIEELPKAQQAAELEGRQWDAAVYMKDMAGLIVSMEAIGQLEENPGKVAEPSCARPPRDARL
jgi:hypothetical protein